MLLTITQIQLIVEPFHRMFSLDNISIQYPHADVERVSVGMLVLWPVHVHLSLRLHSMEYWIRRCPPSLYIYYLGLDTSTNCT